MKMCLCVALTGLLTATALDAQVHPDDYPALAMRMGHEGEVRYHAEYGADGYLTTCTITKSSGFPELDAQTCTLARRWSHAEPQASGSKDGSIKWKLPGK